MLRSALICAMAALVAGTAFLSAGQEPAQDPDYARDVAPILERHCVECHGRTQQKAGLRLDQRAAALAGAEFGDFQVLVPGDRGASVLWEMVTLLDPEERMPPGEDRDALTPAELDVLGRWIDAGAAWPDDGEPASWPTRHWAYRAPVRPAVPAAREGLEDWPRNEVDLFLLAAMQEAGLQPSPGAPRGQLLRRAALDLTGLPPSEDDYHAFLTDERPDAWEHAVNRLLASPHYGEQQARRWLDLARYADSNGYEKDDDRSMWPWRDWVVRAFNDDLRYDVFTIEQLAGDLLPDASLEQRVATGFHRNTMLNNEGGTDPEEFRVAAVVDRVNTTGEVWLGATMGCVQCHDHKYDPITQRDYFRVFAVFNQTADGGKPTGPTVAVPTAMQAAQIAEIDAELAALRMRLDGDGPDLVADRVAWASRVRETLRAGDPVATGTGGEGGTDAVARIDVAWVDDGPPPAATVTGAWEPWTDPTAAGGGLPGPAPRSGERAVVQRAEGEFVQHFFEGARAPLTVGDGDNFYFHVWVDPAAPTRELFLQFHEQGGNWEHRAYLGEDLQPWGTPDTEARRPIGELPEAGAWVRLEVDPTEVGFAPGDRVDGFAFGQHGGRVWWDDAGIVSADPAVQAGVPTAVAEALLAGDDEPLPEVALAWHRETTALLEPLRAQVDALEASRPMAATTLVMQAVATPRTTHVLAKGSHLSPTEEVVAGVPAVLDPKRRAQVRDRLEFAEWLASPRNPLTARVAVNRLWMGSFGEGLVATPDDFGTQGARPSHPELLDWLAVEFVERGWSVKEMYRLILTSSAYRQSSVRPETGAAIDPGNRLLSWFPRRRLDGEELRDQALALSRTLDRRVGGPPVYPPQPAGIDNATYAGDRWRTSSDGEALRRGLYTFWRRTSPYPTFLLFDAPSRELSCARRDRSNTPLQALALLNDPNFVAAAEAFGARLAEHGLAWGFRACTGREADAEELAILEILRSEDGWTAVAQVLLNLDETVTRG